MANSVALADGLQKRGYTLVSGRWGGGADLVWAGCLQVLPDLSVCVPRGGSVERHVSGTQCTSG